MDRPSELDAFKTGISLVAYAASCGYAIETDKSSRNSAIMRHPETGDKIVIAIDLDRHGIYFNVHDEDDNGTIIDFDQKRNGGTLGDVRKRLRAFGSHTPAAAFDRAATPLEPVRRDLLMVRARFEAMERIAGRHPYLQQDRCIPAHVLADVRFTGIIYVDKNRNAVFPHWQEEGLTGYEIKNRNFTGFAPGGLKALWRSRAFPGDRALVIAETAIDALSYHTLKLPKLTRYISTAGTLNPQQPDLIREEIEKMPDGANVINATDNDEGGDELTEQIRDIHARAKGRKTQLVEERPERRQDDWNDVLTFHVDPATRAHSPRP